MRAEMRSLNVAVAGAMVIGEALRQFERISGSMSKTQPTDAQRSQAVRLVQRTARPDLRRFRTLEDELTGTFSDRPARPLRAHRMAAAHGGRQSGGGGVMSVMRGRVFEKVGVNVSTVHGAFSEEFRKQIPGAAERRPLLGQRHQPGRPHAVAAGAGGAHEHAPHRHQQRLVRRRRRPDADGPERRRTPPSSTPRWRAACDRHDPGYYPRFKKWCDEYFYLPHRNEPRGVGGIFYDNLDSGDWDADFAFTRDVGRAFLDVYPAHRAPAHERALDRRSSASDQLIRRGRYVEFNLLYDRGTLFGLKTGGNIEAILMTLPPR